MNNLLRVAKLLPRLRSVTIAIGPRLRSLRHPEGLAESKVLPLLREARMICPSLDTVFFGPLFGWSVSDGEEWTSTNSWLVGADFD